MTKPTPSPPLYYALVQVHFNPIAAMGNYIQSIQDKMRLESYTLFTPQEINQLTFNQDVNPQATVTKLPVWRFTKQDQTSSFVLNPISLTYHTTHYTTHEQFFKDFVLALQWIHDILMLEHFSRIGLRYLNAVIPFDGETVQEYLAKGLHGVSLPETPRYSFSESVFNTKLETFDFHGTLVCRCHNRHDLLGYPPDIGSHDLKALPQFLLKKQCMHAIIDIDHFIETHLPVDFVQSEKILLALHAKIKNTLRAMTTDYAQKRWFNTIKSEGNL
jgi:uncharacterized protein (TIGR04255 family)